MDKKNGALSVKTMGSLNKVLLSKWYWHFGSEKGAHWHNVIREKYGELKGGWCLDEVRGGYGLGVWKGIWRWWPIVSSSVSFGVGNRHRVRFWRDVWCGYTFVYLLSFIGCV